jgi:hypothetical protein
LVLLPLASHSLLTIKHGCLQKLQRLIDRYNARETDDLQRELHLFTLNPPADPLTQRLSAQAETSMSIKGQSPLKASA